VLSGIESSAATARWLRPLAVEQRLGVAVVPLRLPDARRHWLKELLRPPGPPDVKARMEALAVGHNRTISVEVIQAFVEYLDRHERAPATPPSSLAPGCVAGEDDDERRLHLVWDCIEDARDAALPKDTAEMRSWLLHAFDLVANADPSTSRRWHLVANTLQWELDELDQLVQSVEELKGGKRQSRKEFEKKARNLFGRLDECFRCPMIIDWVSEWEEREAPEEQEAAT
jgi:hypothetical protein